MSSVITSQKKESSAEKDKRRNRLIDNTDWNGTITPSDNFKTTEERARIIKKLGVTTERIPTVMAQLERLEYKPVALNNLISLIKTSNSYPKQDCWNTKSKLERAIKWDIVVLCYDGEAGKLPRVNLVSSS